MARNPSPQSKKPKAGGLPAAARRLLKRLAHGDPVKAVEASAGGALVSAGLASVNSRGRLEITPEGAARHSRDTAPEGHAFLAQHRPLGFDVIEEGGHRSAVLVDRAESPLAWLHRRTGRDGKPLLDKTSFAAGERFRADLTRAAMVPRMTSDWSGLPRSEGGRGPAEAVDAALAARQRVGRATAAVGGDLAGVLIDVCGFLKGLEQIERERGWPARSGKVVLQIALSRLAEHYGLTREIRGPARSPGVRSWTAGAETA
jgi:hypothetical protein